MIGSMYNISYHKYHKLCHMIKKSYISKESSILGPPIHDICHQQLPFHSFSCTYSSWYISTHLETPIILMSQVTLKVLLIQFPNVKKSDCHFPWLGLRIQMSWRWILWFISTWIIGLRWWKWLVKVIIPTHIWKCYNKIGISSHPDRLWEVSSLLNL